MTKKQINQNKQEKIEYIVANFKQALETKDHYVSKKDLSKMCYVGVSNETHEIIEVIHNFNNKTVYKVWGGN